MKIHFQQKKRQGQRGYALMLVLAVIAILIVIVAGLAEVTQYSWIDSKYERSRFHAKLLAESGSAVAMHPNVQAGDPALRKDFGDGRSYEVRITTEGGRILINSIDDQIILETVQELFIRWGVDASTAAIAAESLADWMDDDRETRTNGAESEFYATLNFPEYPLNRPFTSLEEMLLVRGMDQVARINPLWRDYFTLHSDGLIDVNSAPGDLLEAFFQISPDSAREFEQARNGGDGIVGTEDDYVFENEDEVRAVLGLSNDEWERVNPNVTLENTLRRIESVGRIAEFEYKLIILAEVSGEGRNEEVTPVARISE
ncbi:MAG: hypothetical protein HKN23_12315 [Verrucomicrobiales bacterium]|nr:hypothetical protein [Verrucomicrobiales bacterium]